LLIRFSLAQSTLERGARGHVSTTMSHHSSRRPTRWTASSRWPASGAAAAVHRPYLVAAILLSVVDNRRSAFFVRHRPSDGTPAASTPPPPPRAADINQFESNYGDDFGCPSTGAAQVAGTGRTGWPGDCVQVLPAVDHCWRHGRIALIHACKAAVKKLRYDESDATTIRDDSIYSCSLHVNSWS